MSDKQPWMTVSNKYLGTHEIRGGENPVIITFFTEAGQPQSEDEVPWCAAFENAIFFEAGLPQYMTHSLMAKSWLHAPNCDEVEIGDAQYGDIVVLNRGGDPSLGHVTNFVEWVDDEHTAFKGQGGNQSDSVDVAEFSRSKIAGVRRPRYTPPAAFRPEEIAVGAGGVASVASSVAAFPPWASVALAVAIGLVILYFVAVRKGWIGAK